MSSPLFLEGGGQASAEIMAVDWSATELGPIEVWPQSLKTALGMMLSSSFPKAIAWGPQKITFHNDAFRPILGEKPLAIGRPFNEVWIEAWDDLEPMVEKAMAGEATFVENFPLEINRHGYPERAYFTFCYSPIRDETGRVAGMMDTVIETTETVMTQAQLSTVNAELAHRMRNVLTMVNSIVTMSLKGAGSIEEGRSSVAQRIAALGRVQSLLVGDADTSATVGGIIEQALAPHGGLGNRVRWSGESIALDAKRGLALALALNELITNSIKYGALGAEKFVDIGWHEDAEGRFSFHWQEPSSLREQPVRKGFGTTVLARFVPASFMGEAGVTFDGEVMRYSLTGRRD